MKAVFQSGEDYLADYDAYKKGYKYALVLISNGVVFKNYSNTLYHMEKESARYYNTYIGEIDLVHKFKHLEIR